MAADWGKIETDYMAGNLSYREIAEKYKVSASSVARHGRKNGWPEKRAQFASKVHRRARQKAADKKASREAKALTRVETLAEGLIGALEKAMQDDAQFYRHVLMVGNGKQGERKLQKLDTKAARDVAATLNQLAGMLTQLGGMMTAKEQADVELARDRLQLEREKAAVGQEEEGGGVVEIAAVDDGPVEEVVVVNEQDEKPITQ